MTAVQFMVTTAKDNSHGYDQTNRNGPDYDCSSLVATALNEGGFPVSRTSWTGNLEQQLRNCGFVDCKPPWKAGDIHLNVLNHVCMSINENEIAQASINEKGTITGGKPGDQTGNEINIRPYYEYKHGWDYHLRYAKNKTTAEIATEVVQGDWGNGAERKRRLEASGYDYDEVQAVVNGLMNTDLKRVAYEVIRGEWGNGDERRKKLEVAGYNYDTVQALVNAILR